MVSATQLAKESERECMEQKRLFAEMVATSRRLINARNAHIVAIRTANGEALPRLENDVALALQAWKDARQAYMQHYREHGC